MSKKRGWQIVGNSSSSIKFSILENFMLFSLVFWILFTKNLCDM
uniref:Uncharacterized protein n=1 Tax=Marseillevirus sp. TaxID=2809551 RepID=A0AA96EN30_9VIRU|nr:hypothetical protein MarDSR_476 [Marseillevirus sp.]